MVTVAHFDLQRVKDLVKAHPSLTKASWDWGFGDWETTLGAASHMGNRAIAEFLIANGARPNLFSAAMLGQLELVRAFVAAQPGVQRITGPHSITLLAHAKAGGERSQKVVEYLQSIGDADGDPLQQFTEKDASPLVGTYNFGIGTNQVIEVSFERGQLNWTRKGTMARPLFYLGEGTFYPCGAPSVRIRFVQESETMMMTVDDAGVVLEARRKSSAR
jgi:hypothetical protein